MIDRLRALVFVEDIFLHQPGPSENGIQWGAQFV